MSCYLEQVRYRTWNLPGAVLPRSYLDSVVAAGGVPVLLPPVGRWGADQLARLDALLITGGPDIDPARYGQPAHASTGQPPRERDAAEFRMLDAALDAGIPVLGVCRGMQVLNIAFGGTLRQHLPEVLGNSDHRPAPASYGRIEVTIQPGSRLADIVDDRILVYCHHHQGLDRLGEGLRPVAWAADGTIEAVELSDAGFVLGVQWHPEEDTADHRLFAALVHAAQRQRAAGGGTR